MKNTPTIAIFCSNLRVESGALFADRHYREAYTDLLHMLHNRGCAAYLVTDNVRYRGKGRFAQAYSVFVRGTPGSLMGVGPITADLVFDRGSFRGHDVRKLNDDFIAGIGDKITTYQMFGEYQPQTVICHDQAALLHTIDSMPGDNVVLKSPRGSTRRGVYIGLKVEARLRMPVEYPVLVQAFLDSSVGIPGQVAGMYDLRVEIGGGEIWGCYIRMPRSGEYRANVALGGSKKILARSDVPSEVVRLVRAIDSRLAGHARFYGLDLCIPLRAGS